MLHTWGRSVRASNPKNVMVRTVVTPEIFNRCYVKTPIFDWVPINVPYPL